MTLCRIPLLACALLLAGCPPPQPAVDHAADVIVIGAGISGLSAALEASDRGARVLVVEANSLGGGHAVMAGGLALVGTPLQAERGYHDDVATAVDDLLRWSPEADPEWVRRYLAASGPEVHDWLARFGVRFSFILDTPQHSVPRFHFTPRGAVNVVVPLLRAALEQPEIGFLWNHQAVELVVSGDAVTGVRVRDLRRGKQYELHAPATIIATGGAQGDLEHVTAVWRDDLPLPERLYVGGGAFADGSGHDLARGAGAEIINLHRQTIFTNGIPDPRDPDGIHGLLTLNPAAIWVDAEGRRFINEAGPSKDADRTILGMQPASHWLIFDREGLDELRIRDAIWMDADRLQAEVLDNPAITRRARSLEQLAESAGLPAGALVDTVDRFNRMLDQGFDRDFGRFTPETIDPFARPIRTPPYYAIQRFPLTRKSMGGIRVDGETRALDDRGTPVAGLYAAGEVTGVAGINGNESGGEGTFLGPSVFMGRLAGRAAVGDLVPTESAATTIHSTPVTTEAAAGPTDPVALAELLTHPRPGYWHFEQVHRIVLEREQSCTGCHTGEWPMAEALTVQQRLAQLGSCVRCH